jgi:hypothetical protein
MSEESLEAPVFKIRATTVYISGPPGATIFFTLDGSAPTRSSFQYQDPLQLGVENFLVKAIAFQGAQRSPVASTYYSFSSQRPLSLLPEDGDYEMDVVVRAEADADEVRYTTDGTIPTMASAIIEGPLTLDTNGTVVVTAAAFVEGQIVGSVLRRTYNITLSQLPQPVVVPQAGRYVAPLRVAIEGGDNIRFTVNGEEPSLNSNRYGGPIAFANIGTVTLKVQSYPPVPNRKPSAVVTVSYEVVEADDGSGSHPVSLLPVGNFEFDGNDAAKGREAANTAVARLLAAAQLSRETEERLGALRKDLERSRLTYTESLHQLEELQSAMSVAMARKSALINETRAQSQVRVEVEKERGIQEQVSLELKQKLFSTLAQLEETETIYRRFAAEKMQFLQHQASVRCSLEEKFITNKKRLSQLDAGVIGEAEDVAAVIAEQRHEIWLLRETRSALERTLRAQRTLPADNTAAVPATSSPADGFLETRGAIDVPTVEGVIPIPSGMMRRITTVNGDGLHVLRKKHSVQARIVSENDQCVIKLFGHSKGVHNFVVDIERILNE